MTRAFSIQLGDSEIIEVLLRNGANVTLLTNFNETALIFAAEQGIT